MILFLYLALVFGVNSVVFMMPCECVVVQKMEAREEGKPNGKAARVLAVTASSSSSNGAGSDSSTGSNRCKSEVIFPIYVRGSSKRNSISRTILDFAGDPIWEAVKSEAKSEVSKQSIIVLFQQVKIALHIMDR